MEVKTDQAEDHTDPLKPLPLTRSPPQREWVNIMLRVGKRVKIIMARQGTLQV
jgi:hypothetical protein